MYVVLHFSGLFSAQLFFEYNDSLQGCFCVLFMTPSATSLRWFSCFSERQAAELHLKTLRSREDELLHAQQSVEQEEQCYSEHVHEQQTEHQMERLQSQLDTAQHSQDVLKHILQRSREAAQVSE